MSCSLVAVIFKIKNFPPNINLILMFEFALLIESNENASISSWIRHSHRRALTASSWICRAFSSPKVCSVFRSSFGNDVLHSFPRSYPGNEFSSPLKLFLLCLLSNRSFVDDHPGNGRSRCLLWIVLKNHFESVLCRQPAEWLNNLP